MKKYLITSLLLIAMSATNTLVVTNNVKQEKDNEIKQLSETNSSLKNELNELRSRNNELENTIQDQQENISGLESKNAELKAENEELQRMASQPKIKTTNTKEKKPNSRFIEATPRNNSREISVELTGYCNCYSCTQSNKGITAMGTKTRVGVIAAPQNISLGTSLFIPHLTNYKSDGIFHVEDRGGAVQQKSDGTHVIDVWFPTHEQALAFGRVKTVAYIQ